MTDLTGKRAIVSGASRGIGRGVAIELARAGAEVVVNFRSHPDEADQVVQQCRQLSGCDAHAIRADFGDQQAVEGLVDEAVERMGGVDIVVSNAVYSDRHLFLDSDLDEFKKTIDVSMWGAFYFVRAAGQKMVAAGSGGAMVVISSPHAHMAIPGAMAYNMAKAANDQMARTAACELAGDRIRVNIIHPGWTDTPGERKFFSEETLAAEGAKLPWGRLGKPEEIGRGAVFLCDPGNEYVTGSTLTIDGGIQLPWREMYRINEDPNQ
ncbi:MAG: oxidoreductase [Rhodopirellula sp.]|nr:oxidoreductase [Rhodopirellula sp.]